MGNTRTIITGMNSDSEKKTVYNQQGGTIPMPGQSEGRRRAPGTIPGIDLTYDTTRQEAITEKPLVGFLVSISRTIEGEFWPIRLGENVIGSESDCAVMLNEAKVSAKHATLTVQINKKENYRLNVWINDLGTTNGTYLNEEQLPPHKVIACKNNDKIEIGGYETLLILFDASLYGLKVSDNFTVKYENGGDFLYDAPERTVSDSKSTKF